MKRMLNRWITLLLAVCMLAGVLPVNVLAVAFAGTSQGATGEGFEWVLTARGSARTLGDWQYEVLAPQGYAVITGHGDPSARALEVPAVLGGADVVGLAPGALSGHDQLESLRLPGNVNAIGEGAIPAGVTLQGYNATYAQHYAQHSGYPFQNLSAYDFVAGVVDYADIAPGSFVRVSANEVRMRELEAARLQAGTSFFLLDPANPYQISYYRVTAISSAVDGFVTLHCETPVADELMRSYSGVKEELRLDMSTLSLAEGARVGLSTMSRDTSSWSSPEIVYEAAFKTPKGIDIEFKGKFKTSFTATYSGGLYSRKSVTLEEKRVIDVTGGISTEKKILGTSGDDEDELIIDSIRVAEKAQMVAAAFKKSDVISGKKPVGTGLFFSWGGFVTVRVQLYFSIDFKGEVYLEFHNETINTTYADSTGRHEESSRTVDSDASVNGQAELKVGLSVQLEIYILCLCIVQGDFFVGVQVTLSYEAVLAGINKGNAMSPNMMDCGHLVIKAVIEAGVKAGILKVFGAEVNASFGGGRKLLGEKELRDEHLHFRPHCYLPAEGEIGKFRYDKTTDKDQMHEAKDCPYSNATVKFIIPEGVEADTTYLESGSYETGFAIGAPLAPYPNDDRYRFLGWYTTEDFAPGTQVVWPYTLTKNETVFYGDLAMSHPVSYQYWDGAAVAPAERHFAGDVFALPETEFGEDAAWLVLVRDIALGYTTVHPLEDVLTTDGSGNVLMPDEALSLCAVDAGMISVHFYESVDDADAKHLLSTLAMRDAELSFPPVSDPSWSDEGWTDADGNNVGLPYTIPQDAPDSLAFIHHVSTDAPEEDDGGSGTTIGGHYPGNSYDTQRGAEAFRYQERTDSVEITGYNPTRSYVDEDGKTVTYTVTARNLVIPSSINGKPVTSIASSAFKNMDTLLTIDFPGTITSMGSHVVSGCDNLGKIDMGGVDISKVPDYFAYNCPNLVEVTLPSRSGFGYGNFCFYNTGLSRVTVRGNVGASAFMNCKNLVQMTITSGCTSIGSEAFMNCSGLTSLSFPDSVTSYGYWLTNGCTALEELTVGGGISSFRSSNGSNVFYIGADSSLKKLVLREGITEISMRAFSNSTNYDSSPTYGFPKLETIEFPSTLKTISDRAFANSGVKSVTIRGALTSIGEYAFNSCKQLTRVEIDGTNTMIGQYAFANASALETVSLNGVKTIGSRAFYNGSMKRISLSEGLTTIASEAFMDCSNLTSLTIPDSVTSCGYWLVEGCMALEELTVGGGISSFRNTSGNNVFYVGTGSNLRKLVLREGITEISMRAFANCLTYNTSTYYGFPKLETIEFPSTLKTIESRVFASSGVKSVTIRGALTSIGEYAFGGCDQLTRVEIDGTDAAIGQYAFSGATALETVSLNGVMTIGSRAFYNGGMRRISLSEGLTTIASEAFMNCSNLTSLTIPDSVTSCGYWLVEGCMALEELTVGGGISSFRSTSGNNVFYIGTGSNLKKLVLREGITEISMRAFANCTTYSASSYNGFPKLETIEFPSTLKTIESRAFAKSGVKTLNIRGALTSIGEYAFGGCDQLMRVEIDGTDAAIGQYVFSGTTALETVSLNGVKTIAAYAFSKSGLRSIELNEGLTSIGTEAFEYCKSLTSLTIPDSVTSCGYWLTYGCTALEELTVGSGISSFRSTNGNNVFYVGTGSNLRKLVLREGITEISMRAFANCTTYSASSYYGFPKLETIEFPSTLKTIESRAFALAGVKTLIIRGALTSIGEYAFGGCDQLTRVEINGTDAAIGQYAFSGTTAMETVSLNGVKTIAAYAFSKSGLRRIELNEGLTSIGTEAFENCKNLTSLTIPDSVTSCGYWLIKACTALEELTVGGSTGFNTSNSNNVFYVGMGSNLRKLVLREGITDVTRRAFANSMTRDTSSCYGFPNLDTVVLPESLKTIGDNNLCYWPSVTTLRVGENVTSIGGTASLGWMTLYTDEYNEYVASYAAARGAQYLALDPSDYPVHTVSFVSSLSGVHPDEVAQADGSVLVGTQSVRFLSGYTLPEVTAPEGYSFAGWYKDAAFTHPATGDDVMGLSDMNLYARFVPKNSVAFALHLPAGRTLPGLLAADAWTLPQDFAIYALTQTAPGEMIQLPEAPVLNGYHFTGWHRDAALTMPFTGAPASGEGLLLYGGFTPASIGGSYQQSGSGLVISDYHLLESDGEALLLPESEQGEPIRGIADYAFDDCAITSVTLPAGLTFVEPHAFTGCQTLTEIRVDADNPTFTTRQGVLYSSDMTILYRYPQGKAGTTFAIPATVTTIAPYAFEDCTTLRSVTILAGVQLIDRGAFAGCTGLGSVALPDSVVQLGEGAFAGCTGVASFAADCLVTIGAGALPDNMHMVVRGPLAEGPLRDYCMASSLLSRSYNIRYLTIRLDGEQVEVLGCEAGMPLPESLFYAEMEDGSLVLALYRDQALATLWRPEEDCMPDADLTLYTTATPLFEGEEITITIDAAEEGAAPQTVTGVCLTAYHGRGGEVTLPRSLGGLPVIALGGSLLADARGDVSAVDIGSGVIRIADTALALPQGLSFSGVIRADVGSYAAQWAAEQGYTCQNSLYTLTFDTCGGAALAARSTTAGTAMKLPVPIRTGASFLGWYLDAALTTPAELNADGLFVTPAASLTLYAAWEQTEAVDCPYTWEETAEGVVLTGYTGSAATQILPGEINGVPVTAIGDSAFTGSALTSVTLPESIVKLGRAAFRGSALQEIRMPGVTSVGSMAFYGCDALTAVTMPAVTEIGAEAFGGCGLTTLALPETLGSIGAHAFAGCAALARVTLPDSLTVLGDRAFANCTGLTAVHIGRGVTELGSRCFAGCTGLTAFTATAGGAYTAVDGVLMHGQTLVCFPAGRSEMYTIPETVTHLAAYAFEQTHLTTLTIPATVTTMGEGLLRQSAHLAEVQVDAAAIPASMCAGCTALTQVTLGSAVRGIGDDAFLNCARLKGVTIPAGVTTIGSMAFSGTAADFAITGWADTAAQRHAIENGCLFRLAEGADIEALTLPEAMSVMLGERILPDVQILPEEAAAQAVLTWRIADPQIAAYADGALLGLRRGETTVTVTAHNGVSAEMQLTVTGVPAQSVTLPEIGDELARGNTLPLTAVVEPAWAEAAPLTWSSSDEAIATVDASGVVTAISAGEAVIRATAPSGRWGETTIRTFHAVESLQLAGEVQGEGERRLMNPTGESATHQLSVTCLPEDHTYAELTWATSDAAVAVVNESGMITARGLGDADITVTAVRTRGEAVTLTYRVSVVPYDLSAHTLPETAPLTYTGEPQQPAPAVVIHGRTLTPGKDYAILTDDAVHAGEHAYTLQGLGNYTGEMQGVFTIVPAQSEIAYTGHAVHELAGFAPSYTDSGLTETTVAYIPAEAPETLLTAPGAAGSYTLRLTAVETADVLGTVLDVPIVLVDSYLERLTLSCEQLTLTAGQSVRPVMHATLAEGTPDGAVNFLWTSSAEAVTVAADGTLTAHTAGSDTVTIARDGRPEEARTLSVTVQEADAWKTIELPANLTDIGAEAFLGLAANRVNVPAQVTAIGSAAFAGMPRLYQVSLTAVPGAITLPHDLMDAGAVLLCTEGAAAVQAAEAAELPYVLVK